MMEQDRTRTELPDASADIAASFDWLRNMAEACLAVLRLGRAELALAKEDLGRMLLMCVLVLPVLFLTWIAAGVLIAWIVYEQSASATFGFAAFAAIQLGASLLLLNRIKTYQRSLSLPATRAQINAIIQEVRHEASRQASSDRDAAA